MTKNVEKRIDFKLHPVILHPECSTTPRNCFVLQIFDIDTRSQAKQNSWVDPHSLCGEGFGPVIFPLSISPILFLQLTVFNSSFQTCVVSKQASPHTKASRDR